MFNFTWRDKQGAAAAAAAASAAAAAAEAGGQAGAGGGVGGLEGSPVMGGPVASPSAAWGNAPLRLGYLYSAPLVHKSGKVYVRVL